MPIDDRSHRNFVLQQGVDIPEYAACRPLSEALRFQPRVVASLVLLGILLQNAPFFLVLAGLLWWAALFPSLNPFDALYRVIAHRRRETVTLPSAPPPRRFSMALAGAFALLISLAISRHRTLTAYSLQAFLLAAATSVGWARLCFGSFLYHVLKGNLAFAIRTLPWGRGV